MKYLCRRILYFLRIYLRYLRISDSSSVAEQMLLFILTVKPLSDLKISEFWRQGKEQLVYEELINQQVVSSI